MSIISEAPYYDHYEKFKSEKKNYTQLLAVPGRVAQAREITEIQSTLKDIVRSISDEIFEDGNILEGCKVHPNRDTKTIKVSSGRVYMKGMVFSIEETDGIEMKATGTEIVGVQLKETVVYASEDPDLRDPALGFENFNQPGCDRLKSELEILVLPEAEYESKGSIAKLATLVNGTLYTEQQAPNYGALDNILATRTYDESGSYIVEGFDVRVEPCKSEDFVDEDISEEEKLKKLEEYFNIVVEPGRAYVHGHLVSIQSSTTIPVKRSIDNTIVRESNPTYSQSVPNYLLNNIGPYVKKILEVRGSMRVENETITINNEMGDTLNKGDLANTIVRVTSKDGLRDYTSKCELISGVVTWIGNDYPSEELLITYNYYHYFEENKDYEVYRDNNNDHRLRFLKYENSTNPVEGTILTIRFEDYLARKDTVYLTEEGTIAVLSGVPAVYGLEESPSVPSYTLPLASIASPPGGSIDITDEYMNISVSNVGLTRFTMSDIHKLLNRIRTIEYDQTILSLNTEAKDYATDGKRGIFTDPFIDLSKIDLTFNLDPEGSVVSNDRPYSNSAIDLDSNMMYLPLISSFYDLLHQEENSTIHTYDTVATLRKREDGERIVLSQNKATKSFLIAPYVSYPQIPEVFINPSLDTWYDDTIIEVYESVKRNKVISSSSKTVNITKYDPSWHGPNVYRTRSNTTTKYSSVGTKVQTLIDEDVISESAVTYLRSRNVKVSGSNYQGNKNITCYFEGRKLNLTPLDGTKGNDDGTVVTDENGSFNAKFKIPPKTFLTGTRLVTFKAEPKTEYYENSASAFYQGIGIARTIRRTITTITTVLKHRTDTTTVTKTYYDPLAQTFVLDNMTILSGVNIYFENVPAANVPVTCEIREVQDGDIKSTIYGFKTLTADEIRGNISSDGSIPTRFRFNDPVLIEPNREYAFVLRSTHTDYRVFVAEIGEYTLGKNGAPTKEMVLSNPYLQGVMMSSSNNSSWTVHQKTDVKFDLIADNYASESEIYFEELVNETGFCKINLSAEAMIFDNTDIKWEYSINDGATYRSITPYNPQVLNELATKLLLRAKLSKSNTDLTPILALDSISVNTTLYDNSEDSYYVSRLISGLDEYSTVTIILDTYETRGKTNVEVFVSPSDSNATPYILNEATLEPKSEKELSYGWWQKTYVANLDAPATQCRIFVKFNSRDNYESPAIRRLRAIMS